MIKWDKVNNKDIKIIEEIADRALKHDPERNKQDIEMDITAAHIASKLNLKKLLSFDYFNFMHDIAGIARHIDRETGKMTRCFMPRCAR